MGLILDTDDDILGLERRRESYLVSDLKREYRGPELKQKSEHIFAYADGEIELSSKFLFRLIHYFDQNPEEKLRLERFNHEL